MENFKTLSCVNRKWKANDISLNDILMWCQKQNMSGKSRLQVFFFFFVI